MVASDIRLVSDDRTILRLAGGGLIATAPPSIAGLIEARGIGLLGAEPASSAEVLLAVDLSRDAPERLPPPATWSILNCAVPMIAGRDWRALVGPVVQILRAGLPRDV